MIPLPGSVSPRGAAVDRTASRICCTGPGPGGRCRSTGAGLRDPVGGVAPGRHPLRRPAGAVPPRCRRALLRRAQRLGRRPLPVDAPPRPGGHPDSPAADDVGELTLGGRGAWSSGGCSRPPTGSCPYEEVWVRLPEADGPVAGLRRRRTPAWCASAATPSPSSIGAPGAGASPPATGSSDPAAGGSSSPSGRRRRWRLARAR